jgi:uncharacterized protein YigA (DUF484 family)
MEMTNDLLGNDLFLINETEEELINSLIGCYNRMLFFEEERENVDTLRVDKFTNRTMELMALKLELVNADIDVQKRNIKALSAELKSAEEMEESRYKLDEDSFDATK